MAMIFFAIVVVGPIIEEICFRGYLQGELRRFWGPVIAIGLSSVMFVAMHRSVGRVPSMLPSSILLGVFVWVSGSIVTSIILHTCWNSLLFLIPLIYTPTTAGTGWLLNLVMLAVGFLALTVLLRRMARWRRKTALAVATPRAGKP